MMRLIYKSLEMVPGNIKRLNACCITLNHIKKYLTNCYSMGDSSFNKKVTKSGAALCWNVDLARLAREHNDANVLVLPARFIAPELAFEIIDTFLNTPFEGGRHQRRIDKIPVK